MTELRYTGPRAGSNDRIPLYLHYHGQTNPQDAFLQLDSDGEVYFAPNPEIGSAIPVRVWDGRSQRWSVPNTLTARACADLFEELRPLLQRVLDGLEVDRNAQGNLRGRLDEDADEASQAIERALERDAIADSMLADVWDASEWFYAGMNYAGAARETGITVKTTDERCEELAKEYLELAASENIVLHGDLLAVIKDIRDHLIADAQASAD